MQSIQNYLKDTGNNAIIDEYELIDDLSKESRKKLTQLMVNYIDNTLPDTRLPKDVTEVCNAMISLFPLLSIVRLSEMYIFVAQNLI